MNNQKKELAAFLKYSLTDNNLKLEIKLINIVNSTIKLLHLPTKQIIQNLGSAKLGFIWLGLISFSFHMFILRIISFFLFKQALKDEC